MLCTRAPRLALVLMSNIAILGGSFNPPHIGHQVLCLMLLETCEIDEVWVVPTFQHSFGKELISFSDRVALCKHMIAPFGPRAKVNEVEKELASTGRMLDTLLALQGRHPSHQYRLVIGADILLETDRWHAWERVAELAPPLVFGRHGYEGGDLPAPPEASSTHIREQLAAGHSALPWVPKSVQEYMDAHGLYRK